MTKAVWENIEEVRRTAPFMDRVTLEGALKATNMKVHPGARRYYEEIGLQIPADMR